MMYEMYENIGNLLKIVQYIEYNLVEAVRLRRVLSLFDNVNSVPNEVFIKAKEEADSLSDKLSNSTLGVVLSIVKKYKVISEDKLEELSEILRKRNDLVHHYFKRKDFEKHSENYPFLKNESNYLKNFMNTADEFNDFLCKLIDELQEEYDEIK